MLNPVQAGPVAIRLPPHNYEAEQALLGAILRNNKSFDRVADFLQEEHFVEPVHGRLFAACRLLIERGQLASAITIRNALGGDDDLGRLGGDVYLGRLLAAAATIINAADYGRLVYDLHLRREMIALGEDLVNSAFEPEPGEDAGDTLDTFESAIAELRTTGEREGGLRSMLAFARKAVDAAEAAYQRGGMVHGTPTYLRTLDKLMGGMANGDLVIVGGRPSMGKEQPIDTPTLTPDGWKLLGNLKIGDYVIGRDGTPTKINGVFPQGVKQAYRVSFRDGTSVECGIDHRWSVAPSSGRSRKAFRVLTTREIMSKGVCAVKHRRRHGAKWRIPVVAPIQFEARDLPVDPYVLGVLIGDGSTVGTGLRFSNPDMDSDIRDLVRDRLPSDVTMHENRSGACPYFDLRGPGRPALRAAIKALGLNCKSPDKFIPADYMFGSVAQRLDLLKGLMDTDGACKRNTSCFYTTSARLADDVSKLARSLGGVVKLRTYDRSHHDKPTEFVLMVKMAICPFNTSRKASEWRSVEPSRYIWSIEPSRIVEQVCISVDAADGLYLTDNYIVTHNTGMMLCIALLMASQGHPIDIFLLEGTAEQATQRLLAIMTGVPVFDQANGLAGPSDILALEKAAAILETLPIFIDDTPGQTVAGMRRRAIRRFKPLVGADGKELRGAIMLDYLQLVDPGTRGRANSNRTEDVSGITRALKAFAKAAGRPLIALSQLSRSLESRDDKRPTLADLRESGSIEQDADIILFPYRQHYYLEKAKPVLRETTFKSEELEKFNDRCEKWERQCAQLKDQAEIILAKARHGSTGSVRVGWTGRLTKFFDPIEQLSAFDDDGDPL